MTVLTCEAARAILADKFAPGKQIWRAYKDGETRQFATEEDAKKFSNLVEPGVEKVCAPSITQQFAMVKATVIQSVLTTYKITQVQYDTVENCIQSLCADYHILSIEEELNLLISNITAFLEVAIQLNDSASARVYIVERYHRCCTI